MEKRIFPPFLPIFITGVSLAVIGWLGVLFIIFYTDPLLRNRWLFFFFTILALSGTALPVAAFIHRRFPSDPPADEGVLLREAIWAGVYGILILWLQEGRILNGVIAFFLLVGLLLVEIFLRMGERARWRPDQGRGNG